MYSDSSSSSSVAAPVTMPSYPNLTAKSPSRFEISVTDPVPKGEGINTFICYKITSLIEYDDASGEPAIQCCVVRRFSDFVWLHDSLQSELRGLLIPALPDKAVMGRFSPEFVEERRRALQLFLVRVMSHTTLRRHRDVLIFLTGTDVALNAARTKGDQGLKKNATKSLMSFFSQGMQIVSNTLSEKKNNKYAPGKDRPKTEDDLACARISAYSQQLQTELSQLEQQVESWLAKEKSLGKAWADIGMSVTLVAQAEGQGRPTEKDEAASGVDYVPSAAPAASPDSAASSSSSPASLSDSALGLGGDQDLSRLLSLLGKSGDQLSVLLQKKETEESIYFREPLKDAQRTAAAVEHMLKSRATLLAEYHSSLDAVDAARAKLQSAQSTPGKEGKLPSLESVLTTCEQSAATKQFELAQITAATRAEFARSQQEKAAALAQIVRAFIRMQLEHSNKVTDTWKEVLAQVTEEDAAATTTR